jgi:hypothetical protein
MRASPDSSDAQPPPPPRLANRFLALVYVAAFGALTVAALYLAFVGLANEDGYSLLLGIVGILGVTVGAWAVSIFGFLDDEDPP